MKKTGASNSNQLAVDIIIWVNYTTKPTGFVSYKSAL